MATLLRRAFHTSFDARLLELLKDRQPDPEPVRLITRFHVGNSRACCAHWRIVGAMLDGHRRLICMGVTPDEARAVARQLARAHELPPQMFAPRLQRWIGTATAGRWQDAD